MTVVTFKADVSKALAQLERHFLTRDNDGHHFVVPVARRKDWYQWCEEEHDDDPPKYAVPVGGSPELVSFIAPEIAR